MIQAIVVKSMAKGKLVWARFWMSLAGLPVVGRIAMGLAGWSFPPYRARVVLARLHRRGYIAPSATIYHTMLGLGANVFIGDNVLIYQMDGDTGPVELGDRVRLHRDVVVETGVGGSLTVGADTNIQPRCQFSAYVSPIRIGRGVSIAPSCAFYPYDHGIAPGTPIRKQPFQTKGGIIIDDEAWLGFGVIVLDGVRIGKGAVVGAGSVVTHDVPDGAVVQGIPARVLLMRSDLPSHNGNMVSLQKSRQ
jgi:acetyltransferase-like isoleucine patch superfamily enzyme